MKNRFIPSVLLALLLISTGCVGSPTDPLSLETAFPTTETGDQPGARKTGDFPTIGAVPKGQTSQMTAAERARLRAELNSAAAQNKASNDPQTEARYRKEVADMQKLIKGHQAQKAETDYD